jgi:hypothetical protein
MSRIANATTRGEIEITSRMVEAGCNALWDSDYGLPTVRSEDVIMTILLEALKAGGFLPKMRLDPSVAR